nr:hypothetical protein HUO10_003286 [Paraburkholderia busanensis]
MRYVDKHAFHDDRLTRGDEPIDEPQDTYEDFLDRRMKDEANLDFPFSFSQVLQ